MVSIIIVSYNTEQMLRVCLDSIFSNLKHIDTEVIVADNRSLDNTVEMIKKNFREVRLIENKQNFGFAKANNLAALKAKGKYLLFLNSDTKILDDSLISMIELLNKDPSIAVVGARLENSDGSIEKSYGSFPNMFSSFNLIVLGQRFNSIDSHGIAKKVDWVNGACMLVRKDLFDKLGGFDEHFFMYVEDMEFCFRVNKAGNKVYYEPKAKILHLRQGSSSRSFAITSIYKGLLYFYSKHKNVIEYSYIKFLLNVKAAAAIIIGIITGNKNLTQTYKQAIRLSL